ncbi:MAG: DUF2914 domain-containing protein [Desulfobacteraceae bacterium]|jgi:hypothetical protein|nr:DUF2914 domain-containing protein [Desulfobacteraceae bacterium]
MFYKIVFITICVLIQPFISMAQDYSPVTVNGMVFCAGIDQKNPVDISTHFSDSIERVFCHTKLSSTEDQTSISHVWYYNDTQMAIVDLAVNAKSWRTWSSKRIVKEWTGTWRVDVISSTGQIICSKEFMVSSYTE